MKTPAHIKDPIVQPLFQILEEIAAGLVRVPRFQRPVVWTDEQRLDLLRSVCSGWPIGSVMLWRTSIQLASFDRLGPLEIPSAQNEFGAFVLDGHQRLSTLVGALMGRPGDLPTEGSEEEIAWEILYDLGEEEFIMAADGRQPGHHYFSLRLALDSIGRMRFQRALDAEAGEELVERSERIANAIYGFKVPILPVVTDEVDQATRIFQKINSTGTDMNPVHMIHALTWKSDFSLNEKLADLREEVFADKAWRTDNDALDQVIVNACKLSLGLDLYDDIDTISKRLAENPEILDDAARHVAKAVEFLSEQCNIRSFGVLPYAVIPSMLAVGLELANAEARALDDAFRYWLWWTLYVEFAGGSNSSRIRRATENIRKLVRETDKAPKELMKPTTDLAPLPSRFDFRHARTKGLSLRMAEWAGNHGGAAVSLLNEQGADAVQHLVTRNLLKSHRGADRDRLSKLFSSPANRIIVSRDGAKDLREHLLSRPGVPERLEHLVPRIPTPNKDDAEGWVEFLTQRRTLLEALEYRFAYDQGLLVEPSQDLERRLRQFEDA